MKSDGTISEVARAGQHDRARAKARVCGLPPITTLSEEGVVDLELIAKVYWLQGRRDADTPVFLGRLTNGLSRMR